MKSSRAWNGQSALYLSAIIYSFSTLFVKMSGNSFSSLFISGTRFIIGVVFASAILLIGRTKIDRAAMPDLLLRGIFGAVSMVASYLAINLTGPGRSVLLGNTYPVFVTIFGMLFYGEKPKWSVWTSLVLCVAGAAFVVRDGSGARLEGDLAALLSSVLAGISIHYVRRASARGVNPFAIYLTPCLLGLPVLFFAKAPPAFPGIAPVALLFAAGMFTFIAQGLMSWGYRSVSAINGSVIFFLETALTVLLGVLLLAEPFSARYAIGLVLIMAGLWFNGR
jgi:drug/metabolite transporter (DMT)-like permease